jgi:NADPH:quinone reductase-like Zn-dependent oxidoreductase
LAALLEDGTLTTRIDRSFDLADAPEALQTLATEHIRGKVVIGVP